jgi:hypothetical protein
MAAGYVAESQNYPTFPSHVWMLTMLLLYYTSIVFHTIAAQAIILTKWFSSHMLLYGLGKVRT